MKLFENVFAVKDGEGDFGGTDQFGHVTPKAKAPLGLVYRCSDVTRQSLEGLLDIISIGVKQTKCEQHLNTDIIAQSFCFIKLEDGFLMNWWRVDDRRA